MGCTCSKSGTIRVTPSWNSFRSENIEYPSNTVISVKSRNLIRKLSTRQSVNLDLCGPLLVSSKEIQISRQNLWVSSCIIPGVHLQSVYKKKCQDFCFYVSSENSLFAGVFDGHGRYGEKVSNFCAKNISKSFTTSKDLYEESPVHFLKTVLYNCASELTQNVKIDVYESGTTAALLMLYDSVFYTANIGDSRVVLATSKIPENLPFPLQMISEERKKADELLNNRNVMLEGPIFAVPLTKDQKPEDREELERIVEFGGRVQRITDKTGNKVGPYRIWEMKSDQPGLAMSRSIGDMIGQKLGVISTPVCKQTQWNKEDLFVIIASDGVWDVFTNQDAVKFVEFYRNDCIKDIDTWVVARTVSPNNTCIAHLLCEEARSRWIALADNEFSKIDDISCVILELQFN